MNINRSWLSGYSSSYSTVYITIRYTGILYTVYTLKVQNTEIQIIRVQQGPFLLFCVLCQNRFMIICDLIRDYLCDVRYFSISVHFILIISLQSVVEFSVRSPRFA